MMPSLFVAHGSPMIAIEDTAYARFLSSLALDWPRPRAILVFSAHWVQPGQQRVSSAPKHRPMYDFGGFPEELYRVSYAPPGSPEVAEWVMESLAAQRIAVGADSARAIDHGVWTILARLYPNADIPVVAASVDPTLPGDEQYRIGQALSGLRQRDVLIVGSGVTVHNFALLRRQDDPTLRLQVLAFEDWLASRLEAWDLETLWNYRERGPHAAMAVPLGGNEHFVPLFYAMGAADDARQTATRYRDLQFNVLTNSVYQFG